MTSTTEEHTAAGSDTGGENNARKWTPESIAARVRRDVYATAWRLRRQILPHAITGAVLGAGLAAHSVAAAGASPPLTAAALGVAGVGAAAGASRKVKTRKPRWARRSLIAGVGAALWLATTPYAVCPEQIAALVGFEMAVAARWWQTYRIGYDVSEPIEEHAEADATQLTPEMIVADWDTYVGNSSGPLPGSQLILPEQTSHGYAFTLLLARGRQTLNSGLSNLDKIASGLDRNIRDLILESEPVDPDATQSDARCRFQVVTDSPIKGEVNFTGPRRRRGLLELGPYADGSGDALYRLYTPGSMWSGVVIGGTGIGKSRVVENVVISALSGGDTEFWYLDPQRGTSSPALARHADWFATLDNAGDMLAAAIAILTARGEENAHEGWSGFTPSPARPGLLIVVEECHTPFNDPRYTADWSRLAREGRKVGVGLLCISQYPGLVTFGGDEALRSSVMEGNAIVLRSTSNTTGQLMAGLQVDPKALPKIPGYAYMQGSEETGTRTAPFRNRNTDPDWADPERSGSRTFAWIAAQPRPGLDRLSVTATGLAGTAYENRHASNETGRSASAALVEALRSGHLPAGAFASQAAEQAKAVIRKLGEVVVFPRFPQIADEAAEAAELSASHRAVLDAVTRGAVTPTEVQQATGLSPRRVATLLKDLVEEYGLLHQPKYGRYERRTVAA